MRRTRCRCPRRPTGRARRRRDLAADDPAPPGVGVAQWASLRRELASQPAELARLRAYFAFSDAVGRLRDGSASADQRRAAALAVDAALDERLERREVSGAEAKVIKVAVLDQLLDDPAARSAALERWQAEQTAAHPPDTAYRVREDDFLRRQAAIVAAWQARPPAQRDPKALQAELDALRRASFASNPAPNGATR